MAQMGISPRLHWFYADGVRFRQGRNSHKGERMMTTQDMMSSPDTTTAFPARLEIDYPETLDCIGSA